MKFFEKEFSKIVINRLKNILKYPLTCRKDYKGFKVSGDYLIKKINIKEPFVYGVKGVLIENNKLSIKIDYFVKVTNEKTLIKKFSNKNYLKLLVKRYNPDISYDDFIKNKEYKTLDFVNKWLSDYLCKQLKIDFTKLDEVIDRLKMDKIISKVITILSD